MASCKEFYGKQRAVINLLVLEGETPINILKILKRIYGESSIDVSDVKSKQCLKHHPKSPRMKDSRPKSLLVKSWQPSSGTVKVFDLMPKVAQLTLQS